MRNSILFTLLFFSVVFGQPSFTGHTISEEANTAYDVMAIDMDGDGDIDVLSASAKLLIPVLSIGIRSPNAGPTWARSPAAITSVLRP